MENPIIQQETRIYEKAILKLRDEIYESFHHRLSNGYSKDEFDKVMQSMKIAAIAVSNIY